MIRPRTLLLLTLTLALVLAPAGASAQAPAGTGFTYQGQLTQSGSPVTGTCDFTFALYDSASAGSQVGSTVNQTLGVSSGLFITILDFGAQWNGEARYMEIAVRCPAGSGSYTTLTPRQQLSPTPYAVWAANVPWSGVASVPADIADGDDDTTYTAGAGLDLSFTNEFSIDPTYTQRRVAGTCPAGSSVASVGQDGTVTCETFTLDEIGNPATDKTFNLANKTIHWLFTNPDGGMHWEFTGAASGHLLEILTTGGNQTPGTHLLHIESDDTDAIPLHLKTVAGGHALLVEGAAVITGSTVIITGTSGIYLQGIKNPDITGVTAGTGLGGGGDSDNVTLNADTTYLQRRVSSSCSLGSITAVAADGTVTCGGEFSWGTYGALAANIAANTTPFITTIPGSVTAKTWLQTYFVATTNNGSNYWTIALQYGTSNTNITTFTTASVGAGVWGQNSASFTQALTASNRYLLISVTKTGSPGNLYIAGPHVTYTAP